ncbi:MAG: tetratricopeptide repeat protein [Clostridia bacterium]|nr:tetratricopeptide repeat protein [Clostridia bacterium]
MWSILLFAAVIYLIVKAFQFHVFMGIGAIVVTLLYGYFRWYSDFCTTQGRAVYAKDPQKALAWFERGYKRGMTIGQQEVYAYYLLREGEVEKSEKIYRNLLIQRLKPELRMKLRADMAVLLMKTGRIDEAIEELEEITLNYINSTTYGTLGYLYLLKNNRRKAESYNQEAYAYNSSDPVILDNCVQLYIKLGRFSEAKKYADELLAKKPYFVEAYYDAAYVYMKLGDFEKAEELIERAKQCRITFMSTIKEEELVRFEESVKNKNQDIPHKLGVFGADAEPEQTEEIILEYDEDIEPVIEYESLPDLDEDEDDPFI